MLHNTKIGHLFIYSYLDPTDPSVGLWCFWMSVIVHLENASIEDVYNVPRKLDR